MPRRACVWPERPTWDAKKMDGSYHEFMNTLRRRRRRWRWHRRRCRHKWNLRHSPYVLMWAYWLIPCRLMSLVCIHRTAFRHWANMKRLNRAPSTHGVEEREKINKTSRGERQPALWRLKNEFFSVFVFCFLKQKRMFECWCGISLSGLPSPLPVALKSSISFIKFILFRLLVVCRYWAMEASTSGSLDIWCFHFFFVAD